MNVITKFFKSRGIGYYVMIPAALCGIVALIVYVLTGVTEFTPTLDVSVSIAYCIFIALCIISMVIDLRIVKFCAFAVGLFGFLMYIVFQVNYISNLFVAIDPTPVTAGFVCVLLFGALAFVAALVSGIMTKSGLEPLKIERSSQ